MANIFLLAVLALFIALGVYSFITFRRWVKDATGMSELSTKLFLIVGFAAIYVPVLMLDVVKICLKVALFFAGL